jgi:hypothetical protein
LTDTVIDTSPPGCATGDRPVTTPVRSLVCVPVAGDSIVSAGDGNCRTSARALVVQMASTARATAAANVGREARMHGSSLLSAIGASELCRRLVGQRSCRERGSLADVPLERHDTDAGPPVRITLNGKFPPHQS